MSWGARSSRPPLSASRRKGRIPGILGPKGPDNTEPLQRSALVLERSSIRPAGRPRVSEGSGVWDIAAVETTALRIGKAVCVLKVALISLSKRHSPGRGRRESARASGTHSGCKASGSIIRWSSLCFDHRLLSGKPSACSASASSTGNSEEPGRRVGLPCSIPLSSAR